MTCTGDANVPTRCSRTPRARAAPAPPTARPSRSAAAAAVALGVAVAVGRPAASPSPPQPTATIAASMISPDARSAHRPRIGCAAVRTVQATRYVTPLREGGSMPGLVEADDDGLYVLKFRGAGQGPKALVAEVLAGELARAAGLPVPELVWIELDPALGRRRAGPGDPGADRRERRAQRRHGLPAGLAHLLPRGRPGRSIRASRRRSSGSTR